MPTPHPSLLNKYRRRNFLCNTALIHKPDSCSWPAARTLSSPTLCSHPSSMEIKYKWGFIERMKSRPWGGQVWTWVSVSAQPGEQEKCLSLPYPFLSACHSPLTLQNRFLHMRAEGQHLSCCLLAHKAPGERRCSCYFSQLLRKISGSTLTGS